MLYVEPEIASPPLATRLPCKLSALPGNADASPRMAVSTQHDHRRVIIRKPSRPLHLVIGSSRSASARKEAWVEAHFLQRRLNLCNASSQLFVLPLKLL